MNQISCMDERDRNRNVFHSCLASTEQYYCIYSGQCMRSPNTERANTNMNVWLVDSVNAFVYVCVCLLNTVQRTLVWHEDSICVPNIRMVHNNIGFLFWKNVFSEWNFQIISWRNVIIVKMIFLEFTRTCDFQFQWIVSLNLVSFFQSFHKIDNFHPKNRKYLFDFQRGSLTDHKYIWQVQNFTNAKPLIKMHEVFKWKRYNLFTSVHYNENIEPLWLL